MKGKKRLEEIKERLERGLRNVDPKNAGRYVISYKPLDNSDYVTPEQKAQGKYIWEMSPSYQFIVEDRENPTASYRVMTVKWPDISRQMPSGFTKEMTERYMGGSEFEPNLRKAIETLRETGKERGRKQGGRRLEKLTKVVISIAGIIAGLFFLSINITGNVIGNLTNSASNFIGLGFLIIGLIAGFSWLKIRRK